MKKKYQTFTFLLAPGTTPGIYEQSIELDRAFHAVTGVTVYETSNGGVSAYKIGLQDDAGHVLHTLTHKKDWLPGENVSLNERYKDLEYAIRGNKLEVQLRTAAVLTLALELDIVFRLEKNADQD
ncbi:hypothetical protein [Adhaeribacter pallidiroseus]|uniref:Uncharacterized protein n=1 Tax=Adhaeribacter pallidiroseus TaxID=2072847 RepID=A0A369QL01_9BACT|nr:hypothetical protein [Adhaeribacter pallidiroseus]RDC65062.1 hypothetical protein AHMF7616_03685 [Adhaeribacter pallidiroseus]